MTERNLRSARRSLLKAKSQSKASRTERTFNFDKTIQYDEDFGIIASGFWNIYHVSPLHNLDYSRLKKYNKLLRENLIRYLPISKENVKYKVKFTQLPGLAETKYDSAAIMINITGTSNNVEKTEFVGILLSRGRSIPNKKGEYISLPIFLCRGQKTIIKSVHIVIQDMFDCRIKQGWFTKHDLMWLTVVFCEDNAKLSESQRKVKFTYKCLPKGSDRVEIRLNTADIDYLWKAIHDENSFEIYDKEVVKFHSEINMHFYLTMKLDLSNMNLDRIVYPHIAMNSEGKFSVKDVNSAAQILKFICELPVKED